MSDLNFFDKLREFKILSIGLSFEREGVLNLSNDIDSKPDHIDEKEKILRDFTREEYSKMTQAEKEVFDDMGGKIIDATLDRFELKHGKYGDFFFDNELKEPIPLKTVIDWLNILYDLKIYGEKQDSKDATPDITDKEIYWNNKIYEWGFRAGMEEAKKDLVHLRDEYEARLK